MRGMTEFLQNEAGAVTVDWVTLTAGILLAGLVAVFAVYVNGVTPVVAEMNSTMNGLTTGLEPGTPPSINN